MTMDLESTSSWFSALWFFVRNGGNLLAWSQVMAGVVTALATMALFAVTWVLARHTRRMAEAASQPFVVARMVSSDSSAQAMNVCLENNGTGTAFDIELEIHPELPNKSEEITSQINILPQGQSITVGVVLGTEIYGKQYDICVSWTKKPSEIKRETLKYTLRAQDGYNTGWTTKNTHHVATELEKLSKSVAAISEGRSRIGVNSFNSSDRNQEAAAIQKRRAEHQSKIEERNA